MVKSEIDGLFYIALSGAITVNVLYPILIVDLAQDSQWWESTGISNVHLFAAVSEDLKCLSFHI